MRNLAIVVCLALLLGACATSPTGRSQLMLVSGSQMSQLGLDTFNQMRKQGKFAQAPRERAYATCVARALIDVLPPPWNTEKWDVEIINDDSANAFALPGGRIGVNRGLFKVAKTPDQLAAVLGHELAHVVARHPAERVSDNLATQIGVSAANAYGAAQGMNPGTMEALLGIGAQTLVLLPFSRAQESEADVLGQRYMAAAGFDPKAAVTLWQNMQKANPGNRGPSFLSTHPSPGDRIAKLAARAPTLEATFRAARANGHDPHCSL
ncbi:MAG: M48 family metallopeptidase [Rhodanobacteraceae bacterium]